MQSKKYSKNYNKKYSKKYSKKYTLYKKIKKENKNDKLDKTQKPKTEKHKYYNVQCHNNYEHDLNATILEEYLKKLGVMPDDKAMETIEKMDRKEFINANKLFSKYCDFDTIVKLPKINNVPLSADVFIFNRFLRINSRFYNYPKFLVNTFNFEIVRKFILKDVIIENILKIAPEIAKLYIPITFNISEKKKYDFPKWYILRPVEGSYGNDIFYVNNEKDLEDKIKYYNTHGNNSQILYKSNVIASEYINNPLLFNKKKMHLRIYVVFSLINGVLNTFLHDFGEILTAKEPFDMDTPFTKDKHDTHGRSTIADFFYPQDFNSKNLGREISDKQKKELWNKVRDICKAIGKIFKKNIDKLLYPNEKNAYHLLGLDIMFRDDMTPVFIESNINPNLDFQYDTGKYKIKNYYASLMYSLYISTIMYSWINEVVLEPLFKYNDPYKAREHHTYIDI
jgi:hypothetical protein